MGQSEPVHRRAAANVQAHPVRTLRKDLAVFRLVRLLPVLIPVLTAVLRNPKVRELLHLKPRPDAR